MISLGIALGVAHRRNGGGSATPAPTGFAISGAAETVISLDWTYGADPGEFTLAYRRHTDASWTDLPLVGADRTATIIDLVPETMYHFRLKADTSSWVTTSGSTDAVVAPTIVSTAVTNTTVELQWSRSEDPDSFEVAFRPYTGGSPGSWQAGPSVAASDRMCQFGTLADDQKYDFQIIASVSGVDSAPAVIQEYTKPPAPTNAVISGINSGTTEITFTYEADGATCDYLIEGSFGSISGDNSTGTIVHVGNYGEASETIQGTITRRSQFYPAGYSSAPTIANGDIT